jgi:hypothetical protein
MYSMKRTMWPLPLKCRAIGTIDASLVPRFTTMLTLTGSRPAAAAASMPASTFATGKSTSFIARNVASSSESRLTVTRVSPASRRLRCFLREQRTVGREREIDVAELRQHSMRRSMFRRRSGSPPVRRSFVTPWPTKTRAMRVISSKVRSSERGRKGCSAPKISFGMQ